MRLHRRDVALVGNGWKRLCRQTWPPERPWYKALLSFPSPSPSLEEKYCLLVVGGLCCTAWDGVCWYGGFLS